MKIIRFQSHMWNLIHGTAMDNKLKLASEKYPDVEIILLDFGECEMVF